VVIRDDDGAALCVGQPAHAWVSGQLARAWGNERFGAVEPWEEVCLAAEQHDIGMAEWDLRPTLNPDTGLPHSFVEMPLDAHLEVWSHAAEKLVPQSRWAALLVSMHGLALYEMRDLGRMDPADAARVRRFMAERRDEQARLVVSLDADRALVRRGQRQLWTWDFMSLALCLDWAPRTARAVPTADGEADVELRPAGEWRVEVDPWPFRDPDGVRVRCEGRQLEGRFDDEEEMRAALLAAPWRALAWELLPG
jgi:hypothetical protein